MDPEIHYFTNIWLTAVLTLIFCHQIASRIPSGAPRLLSLLPVVYLFTTLPLRLSSVHLGAPTIFYLVWLGNFKLLLFAFDQGPLSPTPPLSLLHFIAIALLPIKPKQTLTPTQTLTPSNPKKSKLLIFLLKCTLLSLIITSYNYRHYMHPYIIVLLYSCQVYLTVEVILTITAAPVGAALGLELETLFDKPYFSTSLQDFWSRRWNLMATRILRISVYYPVRRICTRILGQWWAMHVSILMTFLVSGLMHELMYYYLSRVNPTWEVTSFFVLHGLLEAAEVAVKKALRGRWGIPAVVSVPLTMGTVAVTGGWLFFPQVIRNELDLRAISEYSITVRFIGDRMQRVIASLV